MVVFAVLVVVAVVVVIVVVVVVVVVVFCRFFNIYIYTGSYLYKSVLTTKAIHTENRILYTPALGIIRANCYPRMENGLGRCSCHILSNKRFSSILTSSNKSR